VDSSKRKQETTVRKARRAGALERGREPSRGILKPLGFGKAGLVRVLWTKDAKGRDEERNLVPRCFGGRAREVRKPKRAGGLGPN